MPHSFPTRRTSDLPSAEQDLAVTSFSTVFFSKNAPQGHRQVLLFQMLNEPFTCSFGSNLPPTRVKVVMLARHDHQRLRFGQNAIEFCHLQIGRASCRERVWQYV